MEKNEITWSPYFNNNCGDDRLNDFVLNYEYWFYGRLKTNQHSYRRLAGWIWTEVRWHDGLLLWISSQPSLKRSCFVVRIVLPSTYYIYIYIYVQHCILSLVHIIQISSRSGSVQRQLWRCITIAFEAARVFVYVCVNNNKQPHIQCSARKRNITHSEIIHCWKSNQISENELWIIHLHTYFCIISKSYEDFIFVFGKKSILIIIVFI